MPRVSAMPPSSRFWARLDRFECECPSCGQVMTPGTDDRRAPKRLATIGRRRGAARHNPKRSSVDALVWNPYSQRVKCMYCHCCFHAGLVLYPVRNGMYRIRVPPEDTVPDKRQALELRRAQGGGWYAVQPHIRDARRVLANSVNVYVDQGCTCPMFGYSGTCPIHGLPTAATPPASTPADAPTSTAKPSPAADEVEGGSIPYPVYPPKL